MFIRKHRLVIVAAIAIVFIGGATAYAATNSFLSKELEAGTRTTNASIVADASASGGQMVRFSDGAVSPTVPASTPGWELDATNIGLAPFGLSCSTLPLYTGSLSPAAGTTISGKRINGVINASAGNITIEKSCIQPSSGSGMKGFVNTQICSTDDCWTPTGGLVVIDSEIDGSLLPAQNIATSCALVGNGTLIRNYIHDMGSGICFFGSGTEYSGLAQQNYVTDLRSFGESHNEAGTVRDFVKNAGNTRTVKWIGNRLFCDGNVTASLFIQPTWDDIHNLWVTDNYIEGGGFNLYSAGGLTGAHIGNSHATNNRFRATGWGPVEVRNVENWDEWSENYIYAPGNPGAKGAVVPRP